MKTNLIGFLIGLAFGVFFSILIGILDYISGSTTSEFIKGVGFTAAFLAARDTYIEHKGKNHNQKQS